MATKLGTLTLDLVAKIGNYTAPLSKAEQQTKATTQRISADMSKGASAIDMLGNSANRTTQILGSLVATAGIGFSVSELIKYSDTYIGLNNRLKLVTTSETQLATAVKDTFEIAQKSRSSWETTAAIYQRFAQNSDRLGLSQERVASITETVSKAVAISGASTESANAAMMQFGQALASGVLRGEEFNSVNEQTPAVLDAIAKGLGVQRAALKSMAEEGELTTDVLIKALEKADQSVQDLFGKTDVTIGQSFTYLNNEITKFVGESGKGSGAATALSSSVMVLANNLDLLTNAAMVGGAYLAGSYISSLVATTVASVKNTLATAANTAATKTKILADYELAKAELAASAAMVRSMGATNAETAALVANSRAAYQKAAASKAAMLSSASLLGVLGGPVGLGLTVASVAASYIFMSEKTDLTTESIANQIPKVSELTKKYSELNAAQAQSELDKLRSDQKNIQDELTKTSSEMFKFIEITRRLPNVSLKNAGEIEGLLNKVYKGSMSASDALIELRKNSEIPESVITKFNNLAVQVDDVRSKSERNIEAQKLAKTRIDQAGNAAQDSVPKFNAQEKAINGVTSALGNANSEFAKYLKQSQETAISNLYKQGLLEQGYSPSQASAIFDLQQARGMSAILSKEEVESALNVLRITDQTTKAEQAYNDRIKQNSEALKKTANEAKRRREEQERLEKEQTQTRDQVSYEYADDFTRMNIDYQKQVAEINKANFGSEQSKYLEAAKARYDFNAEMYLRQITSEINQHKWSEEEKLKYSLETEKEVIENSGKYNKELKELKLKALGEVTTQELAWLELEKRQRISDASEAFRTDMENIAARYAFEREQILLNKSISDEERKALLNASVYTQNKDESQVRDSAIADYRDVMGFEESPLVRQFEVLQKMRELDLINEEAYQKSKLDLTIKYGASYMESMLGGFASLVDENSKTYAVLFAAQKGFAVAQAMLNIPQAYSKAYDAVVGTPYVGPYIAPAVGAAAAALQVVQAAKINSVNYSGFANGGYTGAGGKYDPAGIVHKGEVVFSQVDVARWGGVGNVEALRTGKGFADGGVVDTKVLDMANNQAISGYLSDRQAANEQTNASELLQTVQINNILDPAIVGDYLAMPSGTKQIMNTIKRNATTINAILGRR